MEKTATLTSPSGEVVAKEVFGPSEGELLQLHLGFKFGQGGTYSTMEFSCTTTSHHRPGDLAHREDILKRDAAWMFQAFEDLKGELNAARKSIGLSPNWSLSPQKGQDFPLEPLEVPVFNAPGSFTPPPPPPALGAMVQGLPAAPAAVIPSTPGWPQFG